MSSNWPLLFYYGVSSYKYSSNKINYKYFAFNSFNKNIYCFMTYTISVYCVLRETYTFYWYNLYN